MKILLFSLLLSLGSYASEVVYGSKSGTIQGGLGFVTIVNVAAGEAIEIMGVIGGQTLPDGGFTDARFTIKAKYGDLPSLSWQHWEVSGSQISTTSERRRNEFVPVVNNMLVGPCRIELDAQNFQNSHFYQVSYKITKPSAANTTTSAPILLPPSQDAVQRWFVRLQVSSDLKTWQDVQPGEFLGSDSARFFRIQTSEQ